MVDTVDGFARRFGEVYQYNWVYGDGSVDLVNEIGKIAQAGVVLANQLGMHDVGMEGDAWRMFRPMLHKESRDTLVLMERYDNLEIWAAAERAAQTSPLWMGAILANQDNEHTWLGEGQLMLDDALDPPRKLDSQSISVDWVTYDPPKKAALVDFPEMVRELANAVEQAGFSETVVRYFGMPTIAGAGLNHAHLWLEHASPSVLGEVLAWRQSAPELHDWRRKLDHVCGAIVSHNLLNQVA